MKCNKASYDAYPRLQAWQAMQDKMAACPPKFQRRRDSLRVSQFLQESGAARRSLPSRKARIDEDWYPSMRLFRQKKFGQWDDVFKEVKIALGTILSPAVAPGNNYEV